MYGGPGFQKVQDRLDSETVRSVCLRNLWCRRRGCKECNRTRSSFDLVKIRAKSPKIRAKCDEMWAKNVQNFAILLYVQLIYKNGTQNESEDVFVSGQVRRNLGELGWYFCKKWWLKCLALSEVVQLFFLMEVIFSLFFSGKFAEIWVKILRTPKNLPAPKPMYVTHDCSNWRVYTTVCSVHVKRLGI